MADEYDFCNKMSDWPPCEYCCEDIESSMRAKTLPDRLNSFLELKAFYKCWDALAPPMLNYLSQEITMSCGLVRYLLTTLVNIEDPKQARQIQTLLELQASLHPPCRPGMHEFYLSALFDPIHNRNFEKTLAENFFDFVKRIETSKVIVEKKKGDSKPGVVNTQQEAVEFLKWSLNSHKTEDSPPDESMERNMLVFNYCVDLLSHDFKACIRNSESQEPLVSKMVWGSFFEEAQVNLHVKEVFRIYANVLPKYRPDVGKYLVLLGEVVRSRDVTANKDFPFYGSGCYEFVSSLESRLRENGPVTSDTIDLISCIPSNWIKCQLSVCMLTTQLLGHTRATTRKKKLFPLFKRR